jgi:hypothetical protein
MKLEIIYDSSPESPREWDNLGTMYCEHGHYALGDEGAERPGPTDIYLPLYLYDHSGITMNTTGFSCGWDSGQVGVIYVSRERIRKEYGWQRLTKARLTKIYDYLRGEVGTYNTYLRGDVYGFRAYDDEGNETDACWGFYGSDPATNGIADHLPAPLTSYEVVGI